MLQNRILHKKANQTKTYRKIYENKKHTSHIRHNNTTQHKVWKHKGPDRNVVDPHFLRFLSLLHPEIFWKAGVQGHQIWHFIQTFLPKIFHWKIVFLNIFPPEVSQTKFADFWLIFSTKTFPIISPKCSKSSFFLSDPCAHGVRSMGRPVTTTPF